MTEHDVLKGTGGLAPLIDKTIDRWYREGRREGMLIGFLLGGMFASLVMFVALAVTR